MIKFMPIAYAGGSAEQIFSPWASAFGSNYDVVPLELPGRGRLTAEPFCSSIEEAADRLLDYIKNSIFEFPYVLYGHSMGCLIAYELAKKIDKQNFPPPLRVCLSGRNAPDFHYASRHYYNLSDEDFIQKVSKLGGNLETLFACQDLRELYLPILRADYQLLGQYEPKQKLYKINSDILFFFSDADPVVQREKTDDWQLYSHKEFRSFDFIGDHFFIHQEYFDICEKIRKDINI